MTFIWNRYLMILEILGGKWKQVHSGNELLKGIMSFTHRHPARTDCLFIAYNRPFFVKTRKFCSLSITILICVSPKYFKIGLIKVLVAFYCLVIVLTLHKGRMHLLQLPEGCLQCLVNVKYVLLLHFLHRNLSHLLSHDQCLSLSFP